MLELEDMDSQREKCNAVLARIDKIWKAAKTPTDAYSHKNFATFLATHRLNFHSGLSWHADNIDKQFRYLNGQQLQELGKAKLFIDAVSSDHQVMPYSNTGGGLVTPMYSLAGQLSGLLYFISHGRELKQYCQIVDNSSKDAGIAIHPKLSLEVAPLAVTDDLEWFLRSQFHYADKCVRPLPLAATLNWPLLRSQPSRMLIGRPVTLWVNRLTAYTLRVAIRLNSRLTSHGVTTGDFRTRCWNGLTPGAFVRDLNKYAMPWQTAMSRAAEHMPAPELQDIIQSAELTEEELNEVRNALPEAIVPFISGGTNHQCPLLEASIGGAIIEQTPRGWIRKYRGTTDNICSKPWRIKHLIETPSSVNGRNLHEPIKDLHDKGGNSHSKPPAATYAVEIFEGDKWVTIECDRSGLVSKTYQTLSDACHANNLLAPGVPTKWRSDLYSIALQLNPVGQPVKQYACGLDAMAGVIRTNNYEIAMPSGQISRPAAHPAKQFLPLADGTLPSVSAVSAVLNHGPTYRVLSTAILQLLAKCNGDDPISVSVIPAASQMTNHTLEAAGLAGPSTPCELESSFLCIRDKKPDQTTLLASDASWWLAGGRSWASWMAAHKPVIYLGRLSTNQSPPPDVPPHQLQRIAFPLLAKSLTHISDGKSMYEALTQAWRDLAARIGLDIRGQLRELPRPVSLSQAAGYWVSQMIISRDIDVRCVNPRTVTATSMWSHRNGKDIWVARDVINQAIVARKLPPWVFPVIIARTSEDQLFHGQSNRKGVVAWRVERSVLTAKARHILDNPQNPLMESKLG